MARAKKVTNKRSTKKGRGNKLTTLDAEDRLGNASPLLAGTTMEALAEQVLSLSNAVDTLIHEGPFKEHVLLGLIHDALPKKPRSSKSKVVTKTELEVVLKTLANLSDHLLKGDDE